MQQSNVLKFSVHFYQNVQHLSVSDVSNKSVCNPFSIYEIGLCGLSMHLKKPLERCTGFEKYCNYTEGGSRGPFFVYLNTAPSERYLQLSIQNI